MKKNIQREPVPKPAQIFLRIKHPSIDPDKLSSAFGIEPDHSVRAGESIAANGKRKVHSESYWIAQLPPSSLMSVPPAEVLADYRSLLATSSLAEKVAIQKRNFERSAYSLQGLSKDEVLEMIGASPIELMIAPQLRKLALQREFIQLLNADGGSVTLLVQVRGTEHPIRIRPTLARRLADTGIELEIDGSM